MSWLSSTVVPTSVVDSNAMIINNGQTFLQPTEYLPIIPKRRGSGCPLEAYLYVNICLIDIIQVVKYNITLCLVKTDNSVGHCTVYPERFPACRRVDPD